MKLASTHSWRQGKKKPAGRRWAGKGDSDSGSVGPASERGGRRPRSNALHDAARREDSLVEVGERLFNLILATASGAQSKSERFGYGQSEFVPWQLGATM